MAGTILITGANGSLAMPAVHRLLSESPKYTLLLTVRNLSATDTNTEKLRQIISHFPEKSALLRQLDLADLTAVHNFADSIAADVTAARLPALAGIVCNAYYWNLNGPVELTSDGFEKTFQVNHLSHAALVLRLLGSFDPAGGRVVLFASDAHWPGKNKLEKQSPAIPDTMELLVKPPADPTDDRFGWGFQRYANSKLAIIMWMYALNRYLEKDPKLNHIVAVAINPGNLSDSRALRTNTPQMLNYLSRFVIQPLRPLLKFTDPTMRTASEAAKDVADLASGRAHDGERGYFTLLKKDDSAPESKDKDKQQILWNKTLEWTKIVKGNTALQFVF
ncbi:NAD(P)-binding protein [Viridothelium virens]|uniref:3beta-hydroxysteroid 3-dehydrogenase n=1 Tax=Viridothelium virens TaxID=1048519 RepID=A0A6A6HN50_VIRVR|nr:NAD(P)-binding protein [Viridothelium virens]